MISRTVVGSHLWGMAHEGSDVDIFKLVKEPLLKILDGTSNTKPKRWESEGEGGETLNYAQFEIGHTINLLIKGNFTTIVGVLSTKVMSRTPMFDELQQITRENLSKLIYHSIKGTATGCLLDILGEHGDVAKKISTALRTLQFGITLLSEGKVEFVPVEHPSENKILQYLGLLETAYNSSTLPETPDESIFRDWLVRTRLS